MINVTEVMDDVREGRVPTKVNGFNAIHRLQTIANMMDDLERAVASAEVGLNQNWKDAYNNLYNALCICKNLEKDLI